MSGGVVWGFLRPWMHPLLGMSLPKPVCSFGAVAWHGPIASRSPGCPQLSAGTEATAGQGGLIIETWSGPPHALISQKDPDSKLGVVSQGGSRGSLKSHLQDAGESVPKLLFALAG